MKALAVGLLLITASVPVLAQGSQPGDHHLNLRFEDLSLAQYQRDAHDHQRNVHPPARRGRARSAFAGVVQLYSAQDDPPGVDQARRRRAALHHC